MENTTSFDLEASLRQWSEDLAGQPGLTPEARHELETHLRDTVEELRARGLNEEESFFLACRRIGAPQQLAKEFSKADPSSIWKMRVLSVAATLLAMRLIQGLLVGASGLLTMYQLHFRAMPSAVPWWLEGVGDGLRDAGAGTAIGAWLVIGLALLIARRPAAASARLWRLVFQSPCRFMTIGTLAVLAVTALECGTGAARQAVLPLDPDASLYFIPVVQDFFSKLIFPYALVILIAGLIPSMRWRLSSRFGRLMLLRAQQPRNRRQ